jgi:hypothetical protein
MEMFNKNMQGFKGCMPAAFSSLQTRYNIPSTEERGRDSSRENNVNSR